MRKVTKSNYRQYYKEYYGIEFGKDFSVHHIDMNRDNNDINNLLLLPKEIHNKFHMSVHCYKIGFEAVNPNLRKISPCGLNYEITMLNTYISSIIEIQKWIGYKETNYRIVKVDGVTLIR